MAEESSPERLPHRFTPTDIRAVLREATSLLERLNLTPRETHILSMAMTYMMYGQLLERKGQFYEMVCGVENRRN